MQSMCPHCGELFDVKKMPRYPLVPTHSWPFLTRQVCPGSEQAYRNPYADRRPLWNGKPNPHLEEEDDK